MAIEALNYQQAEKAPTDSLLRAADYSYARSLHQEKAPPSAWKKYALKTIGIVGAAATAVLSYHILLGAGFSKPVAVMMGAAATIPGFWAHEKIAGSVLK